MSSGTGKVLFFPHFSPKLCEIRWRFQTKLDVTSACKYDYVCVCECSAGQTVYVPLRGRRPVF